MASVVRQRIRDVVRDGAASVGSFAVSSMSGGHENYREGWLGFLPSGEPFYAPIGEMRYDDDRVQCHLCGRWFKVVGAIHIRAAHGITLQEYREMFHLLGNVSTAAPATSERKRETMHRQIDRGERTQPPEMAPGAFTRDSRVRVGRFRSLAALRPDLAAQLHPTRNAGLDPETLGPHSVRVVWWRCATCGHEWQMPVKHRTQPGGRAQGCPACGRRRSVAATIARNTRPISPQISLACRHPELLGEWHPDRNGDLDPSLIASGTSRKVWWRCVCCGHEWQAAVSDRTITRRGRRHPTGCPVCAPRSRHRPSKNKKDQ